jgi:chromatin segregation and condensation protein Rec8/ScpA/Scc1 (kleisin family)
MVVAFLALLELVKQRVVSVKQGTLFEDIELETA